MSGRSSAEEFLEYVGGAVAGGAIAVGMPALSGQALAAAPSIPRVRVRFAMVSYTNHTWPIIAMRNGYFDEVGIEIVPPDARVIFENQTVPLLQNDEVDVSTIFVGVLDSGTPPDQDHPAFPDPQLLAGQHHPDRPRIPLQDHR